MHTRTRDVNRHKQCLQHLHHTAHALTLEQRLLLHPLKQQTAPNVRTNHDPMTKGNSSGRTREKPEHNTNHTYLDLCHGLLALPKRLNGAHSLNNLTLPRCQLLWRDLHAAPDAYAKHTAPPVLFTKSRPQTTATTSTTPPHTIGGHRAGSARIPPHLNETQTFSEFLGLFDRKSLLR